MVPPPTPAAGQSAPSRDDSPRAEVILLAAGRSRRMGGADKLLLPAAPAPTTLSSAGPVPLIRRSVELYRSLNLPVTVVLPDREGPVARALQGLDLTLACNPGPSASTPARDSRLDDGQQASVHAGLRAAPLAAPAVLIALADQPLLEPADIEALLACFEAKGGTLACIPRHAGQRGNPVVLPRAVARMLRDAPGEPSVRTWLDRHPEAVCWFDGASDHFIRDVDTPADAAALLPPSR